MSKLILLFLLLFLQISAIHIAKTALVKETCFFLNYNQTFFQKYKSYRINRFHTKNLQPDTENQRSQ